MVSMMLFQINRAINSAMDDRVIPAIQKIASNLPLGEKEIVTATSTCHQGHGDMPDGPSINSTKNSRSAFDIRDEMDLGLYTILPPCFTL